VLPAAEAATLTLAQPEQAAEQPPEALDLSSAPGAHLRLQRAWQAGDLGLRAACLSAPASSWIRGLEEPVLAGASALARKHLGASTLTAGPAEALGPTLGQRFEAGVGAEPRWQGRHLLGFTRDEVLVCTLACEGGEGCGPWLADAALGGALTTAPAPGWVARLAGGAADHPALGATALGAALLAAVGLLLWRRPRPRW
jgi:hypothetical protein